jgi:DNA-binding MarR family transcriptional regulator
MTQRIQNPDQTQLDTSTRLRVAVGRLSRRLRSTPAARAAGLTPTKSSILLAVVRGGPVRLSELGETEGINPTMLSRVVGDLVEVGLLERSSDAKDRRAAWVSVTANGRRLAERIRRERTEAVNAALAGLSGADRQLIEASLPALEALAEQLKDVRR